MVRTQPTTMKYGQCQFFLCSYANILLVRLGNSGLKVSKIILGCLSYGDPTSQSWLLSEEEGIKHIKAAYDAGINAFDTANVNALYTSYFLHYS